ncbi:MAG: hypothetical protein CSB46_10050, partial [Micrococcales bacterium]
MLVHAADEGWFVAGVYVGVMLVVTVPVPVFDYRMVMQMLVLASHHEGDTDTGEPERHQLARLDR